MARGNRTGPRPGPERRCFGKKRYSSAEDATAAIEALGRERGTYTPDWAAYRCRHCGRHHIGHRRGLGRERGI